MKKLLFLFTGIATAAGLTSCKKVYTCECTYTYTYTSNTAGVDSHTETTTDFDDLDKQSKKDATAECESYEEDAFISYSWGTYSLDKDCNLK
jgi:hypothetical protein